VSTTCQLPSIRVRSSNDIPSDDRLPLPGIPAISASDKDEDEDLDEFEEDDFDDDFDDEFEEDFDDEFDEEDEDEDEDAEFTPGEVEDDE